MIKANCHCGAVQLEVTSAPESVSLCNCSICKRLGGLWAYYDPARVVLLSDKDALDSYIWGDKMIQICRCGTCGCTTHWESIDPELTGRMGINARMMSDIDLDRIPVCHVDGASF